MPRDLPIGNGSLLITFDAQYCLRDLYFPNVGHENNTLGHPCRVGIWIDGSFRWLHHREGYVDVILKYQSKYHELFPEQEAPVGGDATPSPKTLRRMAVKRASREECPGLVRLGAL
jgi:hypothetical protein